MVAVHSGFPAQSTQSVIKDAGKASRLPSLPDALRMAGYSTAFYYGGDLDFANMRAYLISMGFNRFISQDDFPRSLRTTKWGIHDEHLFERLLSDLDTTTAPFFKTFFTLSSHEPFEIPVEPAFPGVGEENMFLSSIHYTDSCLGTFLERARQRPWYANTLFILVSDHGHRMPGNNAYYEEDRFRIPMLWLGDALDSIGVVESYGSQTDVAATLLAQLSIEHSQFTFSRDLLASYSPPFAYYAFNDGFGFVAPGQKLIWDHVGEMPIVDKADSIHRANAFGYFQYYHRYFLAL